VSLEMVLAPVRDEVCPCAPAVASPSSPSVVDESKMESPRDGDDDDDEGARGVRSPRASPGSSPDPQSPTHAPTLSASPVAIARRASEMIDGPMSTGDMCRMLCALDVALQVRCAVNHVHVGLPCFRVAAFTRTVTVPSLCARVCAYDCVVAQSYRVRFADVSAVLPVAAFEGCGG
jgi:hypothetical protein